MGNNNSPRAKAWNILEKIMAVVGCVATVVGTYIAYKAMEDPGSLTRAADAFNNTFNKEPKKTLEPMMSCFETNDYCTLTIFVDNLSGPSTANISVETADGKSIIASKDVIIQSDGLSTEFAFDKLPKKVKEVMLRAKVVVPAIGKEKETYFEYSVKLAPTKSGSYWEPTAIPE